MKTDDFDYCLPPELIAQQPLPDRVASKLLVLAEADLSDHTFSDLPEFLQQGDLLVMNDTRVIPARLHLKKSSGGRVEVMLERFISSTQILALARSNKVLKQATQLYLGDMPVMSFIRREGQFFIFEIEASVDGEKLFLEHGHIPLPPYIQRADSAQDHDRYQTVYAQHSGAVAAPTAGLHFDQALLSQLNQMGVDTAKVTLHVGAGTFQPVKVEDVTQHQMHKERIEVSSDTIAKIRETKKRGRRVIAVGTTSVRALESAAMFALSTENEQANSGDTTDLQLLKPYSGDTQLFIYPGYQFKVVDAIITNFHLPKSTLLMMISAFAGKSNIFAAYQYAIKNQYRFFSYGDAMLLSTRLA